MFGTRTLILAAHPDDEIVACAAAIGRAQRQGAKFFVLNLTNGCIARDTLWPWQRHNYDKHVSRRRTEAEKATEFLGITIAGCASRPARHLWRNLPDVYAEVAGAIEEHDIDQLWVPAYEGGHADHDGLNAVGSVFASHMNVLEFAEYNFSGRKARSQEFPFPNGSEQTLALTPEEQARKRAALTIYASEKLNLNYVETEHECYRPLATYDYSQPPHPGKLWYARFQWVPFRHPRVDFTKPEDVSKSIASFLASAR
ncbi:MAG: PIG-L family deacetylase [Alphaproteobacteria bacterium]|nr:PIG-L family deacetylase [Alphaproteobacteria bacterium]